MTNTKRPKHFKHISNVARLMGHHDLSVYHILSDGHLLQALCLKEFEVEGFVKLSQVSKDNRLVLEEGCTNNDPSLIREKLNREKIGVSLSPEYVYLTDELSSSGWVDGNARLTSGKKWKDSFVTGWDVPQSRRPVFEVWVVQSRENEQLVGLTNIADGYGDIVSFYLGSPKDNPNYVPELFENACISVEHIQDYIEEEVPDHIWEGFLNPPKPKPVVGDPGNYHYYLARKKGKIADVILHFGNVLSAQLKKTATARELWDYICEQGSQYDAYTLEYYVKDKKEPIRSLIPAQRDHPETSLSVGGEPSYNFKEFSKRVQSATKNSKHKHGRIIEED